MTNFRLIGIKDKITNIDVVSLWRSDCSEAVSCFVLIISVQRMSNIYVRVQILNVFGRFHKTT